MLVFSEVSSIKTMRSRCSRMKGWRRLIQIARSRATSGRFCSLARKSFFVRQTEPLQQAPDCGALHIDPVLSPQGCDQLVKRGPGVLCKPGANPLVNTRKLPMTAPALRLWRQPARLPFQPHHVVDELDGNAKTPGRFGVRIALFHKQDGAFA